MVSNYDQMRPLGQQDPDPPCKLLFPETPFLKPYSKGPGGHVSCVWLDTAGAGSAEPAGPVMLSH